MDIQTIGELIGQSLASIKSPRFYDTERGFQGCLLAEIHTRLAKVNPTSELIIEQEHQKRFYVHGTKIRPDLIIHIPFAHGTMESVRAGNLAAFELKLRADQEAASDAFANLQTITEALNYSIAIFINIDSENTYADICPASLSGKAICYAVRLDTSVTPHIVRIKEQRP